MAYIEIFLMYYHIIIWSFLILTILALKCVVHVNRFMMSCSVTCTSYLMITIWTHELLIHVRSFQMRYKVTILSCFIITLLTMDEKKLIIINIFLYFNKKKLRHKSMFLSQMLDIVMLGLVFGTAFTALKWVKLSSLFSGRF